MYTKKRAYLYRHKKTLRPNHPYALLVEERVRTSRSRNVYSFDSGEHRFSSFCPFFSNRSTQIRQKTLCARRGATLRPALCLGRIIFVEKRGGGLCLHAVVVLLPSLSTLSSCLGTKRRLLKGIRREAALSSLHRPRGGSSSFTSSCERERPRRDTRLRRELL